MGEWSGFGVGYAFSEFGVREASVYRDSIGKDKEGEGGLQDPSS